MSAASSCTDGTKRRPTRARIRCWRSNDVVESPCSAAPHRDGTLSQSLRSSGATIAASSSIVSTSALMRRAASWSWRIRLPKLSSVHAILDPGEVGRSRARNGIEIDDHQHAVDGHIGAEGVVGQTERRIVDDAAVPIRHAVDLGPRKPGRQARAGHAHDAIRSGGGHVRPPVGEFRIVAALHVGRGHREVVGLAWAPQSRRNVPAFASSGRVS